MVPPRLSAAECSAGTARPTPPGRPARPRLSRAPPRGRLPAASHREPVARAVGPWAALPVSGAAGLSPSACRCGGVAQAVFRMKPGSSVLVHSRAQRLITVVASRRRRGPPCFVLACSVHAAEGVRGDVREGDRLSPHAPRVGAALVGPRHDVGSGLQACTPRSSVSSGLEGCALQDGLCPRRRRGGTEEGRPLTSRMSGLLTVPAGTPREVGFLRHTQLSRSLPPGWRVLGRRPGPSPAPSSDTCVTAMRALGCTVCRPLSPVVVESWRP